MRENEKHTEGSILYSDIGEIKIDSDGSPVCGVRMDTTKAYSGIPDLLQNVIDKKDASSWETIVEKIDYIYNNLEYSLLSLDTETGFIRKVQSEIKLGKKLLFKPNLVGPDVINYKTHGEGLGSPICTEWAVIAALMRWFHDKLLIDYNQMSLGEASTSSLFMAKMFEKETEQKITSEAIFEGKSGDQYGGWAFYFVRKYLKDHHPPEHTDDPMNGYEESVNGKYLAPGAAGNRLMVYDLNKLEDPSRGRTVPVQGGENYPDITLHKVIIGGDPKNKEDIKNYPGCVLINVPKMKIHAQDLITNAIKNLGIGLYPVQCHSDTGHGPYSWKYAMPPSDTPNFKGKLPHMPWVVEIDEDTGLPKKDSKGEYIVSRTAGMSGTQSDVIRATQDQNVFMVHVSDSIDMINLSHNPEGIAVRIPEGYIWSSLDCVAMDLLCARYCFKTVPMSEGIKLKKDNNWNTEFVHHVPTAQVEGKNIVTFTGLDSPLFRYNLYKHAERRGIGEQLYYVTGWDSVTNSDLASVNGHIGRIEKAEFVELMTKTMYYNPSCMLWDMQLTLMSYAGSCDTLKGNHELVEDFLNSFDENGDGIIDYDENGKKGFDTHIFLIMSNAMDIQLKEKYGTLKANFYNAVSVSKNSNQDWNPDGHSFAREITMMGIATQAYNMSNDENTHKDPYTPGMNWGNGMWPSWELAKNSTHYHSLYGSMSPDQITIHAIYGNAFCYADKTQLNGKYTRSSQEMISDEHAVKYYFDDLSTGADLLDFTLYVPPGFGSINGEKIPNVEETDVKEKLFTAYFNQGKEIWQGI